jgi:hypothetical protein
LSIVRAPRPESNFYLLNKAISENHRLSWAARGLLVFLLGKPDHWNVSVAHLRNETSKSAKPTGRDGVYGLLAELIETGYVQRRQTRGDGGAMGEVSYLVSESPLPDSPLPASPDTAQPLPANPTLVSIEVKQGLNEAVRIEKPLGKQDPMEGFETFWKLYPRKVNKVPAEKAWKKLSVTPELLAVMIGALGKQSTSIEWLKSGGQYIPHPASWLNARRWEDEIPSGLAGAGTSRHTNLDQIDHTAGLELDADGNYRVAGSAQ